LYTLSSLLYAFVQLLQEIFLMLLDRSVAEFFSKKEAKFCYLSQKSTQKLATVGILWQSHLHREIGQARSVA